MPVGFGSLSGSWEEAGVGFADTPVPTPEDGTMPCVTDFASLGAGVSPNLGAVFDTPCDIVGLGRILCPWVGIIEPPGVPVGASPVDGALPEGAMAVPLVRGAELGSATVG